MNEDRQVGMWDRESADGELAEALEIMVRNKGPAREHSGAKRRIKKRIAELGGIKDGERIRVGRFVITGRTRDGGGFEVPEWTSTGVGHVEALD